MRTSRELSRTSKTAKKAKRVILKGDSSTYAVFQGMGDTQSVLESLHIRVPSETNQRQ